MKHHLPAINQRILTINIGSSSLKASYFTPDGTRQDWQFVVEQHQPNGKKAYKKAFANLFTQLAQITPDIIAHRFVHGGDVAEAARWLNAAELVRLKAITHLAPLHLPISLMSVKLCSAYFITSQQPPRQAACFDTAFHHNMPKIAQLLPIPATENMRRYGFHGLSYAYIASQLTEKIGKVANGRVIVAHLGAGASLCLMKNLQSRDTTMGYTPAGGVCMATRAGDLDPGVMLALADRHSTKVLSHMVNHQMGLLAISHNQSSDMQVLLNSKTSQAKLAVDYFCQQITAAIGSLAAKAGGLDALVFSGGIGEHAAIIRHKICQPLAFMGIHIDEVNNKNNTEQLNAAKSLPILKISTDEALMMAKLVSSLD